MRGECGGRWTRGCCCYCRSLLDVVVLVLFCPVRWATRGATLWEEIQASSISKMQPQSTRVSKMPGVEDECQLQRMLRRKPRLAPACDRPFAMPRLISNVSWFAERLGTAVSGHGLPKQKRPLLPVGIFTFVLHSTGFASIDLNYFKVQRMH